MKKLLIPLAALVISAPVFSATNACLGAGADATITPASKFIVTQFTQKCSANVYLSYDEIATEVTVGSASKKGKTNFTGSSAGGAVTANTTVTACPSSGCTAAPTPPTPGGSSTTTTTTTTTTPTPTPTPPADRRNRCCAPAATRRPVPARHSPMRCRCR